MPCRSAIDGGRRRGHRVQRGPDPGPREDSVVERRPDAQQVARGAADRHELGRARVGRAEHRQGDLGGQRPDLARRSADRAPRGRRSAGRRRGAGRRPRAGARARRAGSRCCRRRRRSSPSRDRPGRPACTPSSASMASSSWLREAASRPVTDRIRSMTERSICRAAERIGAGDRDRAGAEAASVIREGAEGLDEPGTALPSPPSASIVRPSPRCADSSWRASSSWTSTSATRRWTEYEPMSIAAAVSGLVGDWSRSTNASLSRGRRSGAPPERPPAAIVRGHTGC